MQPRPLFYILDDSGAPVIERDAQQWTQWFEQQGEARILRRDELVEGVTVSTVFLGIDHNSGGRGPPLLWETMIFGGPHDGYQTRHASKGAALKGHDEAMAKATTART